MLQRGKSQTQKVPISVEEEEEKEEEDEGKEGVIVKEEEEEHLQGITNLSILKYSRAASQEGNMEGRMKKEDLNSCSTAVKCLLSMTNREQARTQFTGEND